MNTRNIFALALILLGVGFLLDTMEYMEFSETISDWWPLLIIILGVVHLSRKNPPIFSGLLIIGIGVLLLAERLEYLNIDFWSAFWPLLIIIIGLSMLFPTKRCYNRNKFKEIKTYGDLNLTTLFSGQSKKVDDKNFKGGTLNATFGAIELDLTDAELSPEGAVLNLTATFAGLEISVPRHWKLEFNGTPMFGGFEDKTRQNQPDVNTRTLIINYNVILGGIEVNNKAR